MAQRKTNLVSVRLHYFQTVARAGSIRRAAQSLNIAPSAISRTLRALEDESGYVAVRAHAPALASHQCWRDPVILRRSQRRRTDRAAGFIGDLAGLRRGSVSITAIESVTRGLLPDVLQKFWKRHPDIRVDVMTMGSQQGLEAVVAERL